MALRRTPAGQPPSLVHEAPEADPLRPGAFVFSSVERVAPGRNSFMRRGSFLKPARRLLKTLSWVLGNALLRGLDLPVNPSSGCSSGWLGKVSSGYVRRLPARHSGLNQHLRTSNPLAVIFGRSSSYIPSLVSNGKERSQYLDARLLIDARPL